MIVFISVVIIVALAFLLGRIKLSNYFHKEIKQLFLQSESISGKRFSYQQISSLPDPVQRYFKYVLKDGQPYISYIRATHSGLFKAGFEKDWVKISGEQYATTGTPGFIWRGITAMFTARDMFIAGKGRLVVTLLSLFKVVDARGEQYDEGELLRWLGESVLYPTNFLSSERLEWFAVDYSTAKLEFTYKHFVLDFIVRFNDRGEITRLQTKRFMDASTRAPWVIDLSGYREMNSVMVPTIFDVQWILEKGVFSYARFNLLKLEYDKPKAF